MPAPPPRILVRVLLAAALAAFLAGYWMRARVITTDTRGLVRRCAACQPEWLSYDEDLKAAIGARAHAQWKGELFSVQVNARRILLTFRLEAPWAEYNAAVPLLVRTPAGRQYRTTKAETKNGLCVWRVERAPDAEDTPDWIEVRYPVNAKRVYLGPDGRWDTPSPPA
jgi:hypothetical protein